MLCNMHQCTETVVVGKDRCMTHQRTNNPVVDPSSHPDEAPLWRHTNGFLYRITGFCIIEKGMVPAVMYERYQAAGPTWVRPCSEFFDGRFIQTVI